MTDTAQPLVPTVTTSTRKPTRFYGLFRDRRLALAAIFWVVAIAATLLVVLQCLETEALIAPITTRGCIDLKKTKAQCDAKAHDLAVASNDSERQVAVTRAWKAEVLLLAIVAVTTLSVMPMRSLNQDEDVDA